MGSKISHNHISFTTNDRVIADLRYSSGWKKRSFFSIILKTNPSKISILPVLIQRWLKKLKEYGSHYKKPVSFSEMKFPK